ncbi:MAG: RnfABCDGE type electron transport complex subunit B [Anaerovoracaceae bacterium]
MPIVITAVLGLIFSIILVVASTVMAVPVDERQVKVRAVLPGANCGACGFAGCDDYAAAVASDPENVPVSACIPGGADVAAKIAETLGVSAGSVVPQRAYLMCSGDCNQKQAVVNYTGKQTCESARQFYGGQWSCASGCLGLGDCMEACPYDAIRMFNGIPGIDHERCVGCGICAKTCPQGLLRIMDYDRKIKVSCSNHEVGKKAMQACKTACIGCKKCEKTCKFDAIHVEDGLAVIDYEKCKACGLCAKECPTGAIVFDRSKKVSKAS